MTNVVVYKMETGERIEFDGKVKAAIVIKTGDTERNQPGIFVETMEGHNLCMNMELSWEELITLWEELTRIIGRRIIKERVEDVLAERKTCHYCGNPFDKENQFDKEGVNKNEG